MQLPLGVLSVFAGLGLWVSLGVHGLVVRQCHPFVLFGILFMLYLNVQYIWSGPESALQQLVSIYDVLGNFVVKNPNDVPGFRTCADNACTKWGDMYTFHATWVVAFYERIAYGPPSRSTMLIGHVVANSIVFILMHVQFFFNAQSTPTFWNINKLHRWIGRISLAVLLVGLACAVGLASEHGDIADYGGNSSKYGFYLMALTTFWCAANGAIQIFFFKNVMAHRIWMWRFIGSMWGSFWLYRAVLLVLDPLLLNFPTVAFLICTWGSAPAGVVIAEVIRRWVDDPPKKNSASSSSSVSKVVSTRQVVDVSVGIKRSTL